MNMKRKKNIKGNSLIAVISVIIIIIIVIILGIIVYKKYFKQPRYAYAPNLNFASYLPTQKTSVVFYVPSIMELSKKININNYPILKSKLKQYSRVIGFDITNSYEYNRIGMDVNKPIGIALFNNNSFIMGFVGISDEGKFKDFLNAHKNTFLKIEEKVAPSGIKYYIEKYRKSINKVYFFKEGYYFIFSKRSIFDKGNLQQFLEENILNNSIQDKLIKDKKFNDVISKVGKSSDFIYYLDYLNLLKSYSNFIPKQNLELFNIPLAIGVSLNFEDNNFKIRTYAVLKKENKINNIVSLNDIIKKLPENPLVCMYNTYPYFSQNWDNIKESFNFMIKTNPLLGGKYRNIDELIKGIENNLQKEFKLNLDLEKDIISNINGSFVVSLYNFSKNNQQKLNFDLILALKLNNSKNFNNVLHKIINNINNNLKANNLKIKIEKSKVEDIEYNYLELNKLSQDIILTPTFGIYKDYLIFTSTKDLFIKLIKGEGGLLKFIKHHHIVKEDFYKEATGFGFIKFDKLVKNIFGLFGKNTNPIFNNILKFTNHIKLVYFKNHIGAKEVASEVVFYSDIVFLKGIFTEIENLLKK